MNTLNVIVNTCLWPEFQFQACDCSSTLCFNICLCETTVYFFIFTTIKFIMDKKKIKIPTLTKESRELGKLGKAKFQSQILVNFGEVKFLHRARRILKDSTHPSYSLFTLLPPGKRYRSMCRCTTRLQSSFFLQAVRLLNSSSTHFPE